MTTDVTTDAPSALPLSDVEQERQDALRLLDSVAPGRSQPIARAVAWARNLLPLGARLNFQDSQEENLSLEAVKVRSKSLNIALRKRIANASIVFVGLQILASNAFFGYYLFNNVEHIDASIMIAWLTTSVVEIVAILGIVANSLFPNKNGNSNTSPSVSPPAPQP